MSYYSISFAKPRLTESLARTGVRTDNAGRMGFAAAKASLSDDKTP
jgi:hypothetical protein